GVVFEARFARADCTPCPLRARCTRSKQEPRIIGLLPRGQHEALQAARREQTTEEFRLRYAARAGIEGTHEQAIRRCGLRQCRYDLGTKDGHGVKQWIEPPSRIAGRKGGGPWPSPCQTLVSCPMKSSKHSACVRFTGVSWASP